MSGKEPSSNRQGSEEMSGKESWPGILSLLSFETRLLGLVALLAQAAFLYVIYGLSGAQRIWAFIVWVVLMIAILVAFVLVVRRTKSHDHFPVLKLKVSQMIQKLIANDFLPQLIVAITRGGLAVAGMLSRELGDKRVPVIALTPQPRPGGVNRFNNRFNRISLTRTAFVGNAAGPPVKVLIIDDICRSGGTLDDAMQYLEGQLNKKDFTIKTAALSFYAKDDAIEPSFYVGVKLRDPIRDASGELEKWE
jgi:hypoxanthine phosphoribosyltransferase